MNGIEVCGYMFAGVHYWAGVHLSSSKPDAEPIFIDPWWRQCWNDAATGPTYGWKTQAGKLVAMGLMATSLGLLIVRALYPLLAKRFPAKFDTFVKVQKAFWEHPKKIGSLIGAAGAALARLLRVDDSPGFSQGSPEYNYWGDRETSLFERLTLNLEMDHKK
jgi:hypothetical protein